jgi:quercetin dioxygenase-like cupin family protein
MEVVDLLESDGRGPLWGAATEDLNATLLVWGAGERVAEHVNDERDVLLVVLSGGGMLVLDQDETQVRSGHAVVIPKGVRRAVVAGPAGIRYLTAHRVRGGLQISRLPPA